MAAMSELCRCLASSVSRRGNCISLHGGCEEDGAIEPKVDMESRSHRQWSQPSSCSCINSRTVGAAIAAVSVVLALAGVYCTRASSGIDACRASTASRTASVHLGTFPAPPAVVFSSPR